MTDFHDIIARMKARAEDPEFQKLVAEAEKAEKERRALWQAEVRAKAIAKTGVPHRVTELIASMTETEPVKAVETFLAGRKALLFLSGPPGCGKTLAACHGLLSHIRIVDDGYELPEARRVGRFVKALDLVRAGTYDDAFWTRLKATPFLVVDDLGTEPLDDKGWALANIAALIDARYDSTAKTVITTNLDAGQFKARYGASDGGRLVDRLRESAEFVQFDGASMRQSHG